MKKITFQIAFVLFSFSQLAAQTNIDFDAACPLDPGGAECWATFMNVTNLPAPYGDGVYQFGSDWGIADLVAIIDTGSNTVTLKPNRIGDPDPYWQTGDLTGNKIMDANLFVSAQSLKGTNFTFNGSVDANTLNETGLYDGIEFSVTAFIKVFNADFSQVIEEDVVDLRTTSGDFTLSMDATAYNSDENIQFGFQFIGPNIGLDSSFDSAYDDLGSIVVGANSSLSTVELTQTEFSVFPNPSGNNWNLKSTSMIQSLEVFDILGKNVMTMQPNALEAEIDGTSLRDGLYLARITSAQGTKTIKLIKN